MTKHSDINEVHAKLFGEGWHIENHPESVTKSNRNKKHPKCKYLSTNGTCNCYGSGYHQRLCISKSHCSSWSK